jgi:uncharacterized protein (DUF2237 family)
VTGIAGQVSMIWGGIRSVSWLRMSFLAYSASVGNDLSTPMPQYGFPGVKDGDKWCLCVTRWQQALEDDMAPMVDLEATHESALDVVNLDDLKQYAAVSTDNFD